MNVVIQRQFDEHYFAQEAQLWLRSRWLRQDEAEKFEMVTEGDYNT
jgi:hypothetical protein